MFGDVITESQILSTSTALESKTEARNIRNYDQQIWEESAKNLCYEGIKCKFTQNPWLKNLLLSTNDDILGEATYDKLWGMGIPFHRRDCADRSQWHSNGIMGEILMEIRAEPRPAESAQPMPTATSQHADHTVMDTENTPRQNTQS